VTVVHHTGWHEMGNDRDAAAREWYRAVDDAGRFLDTWAGLALSFGWQPLHIFGPGGLKIEQGPTSGSMAECALPHPVQAATSLRMLIFSRRAFSASGSAADHSTSPPCNGRT
jgi:hypothetical protein